MTRQAAAARRWCRAVAARVGRSDASAAEGGLCALDRSRPNMPECQVAESFRVKEAA